MEIKGVFLKLNGLICEFNWHERRLHVQRMIALKFYCSHATDEAISEIIGMTLYHAQNVKIIIFNQSIVSILARVLHFKWLI